MTKCFAHRGIYVNDIDENTLGAFREANKHDNFTGFECDVRYSKDKQLVVVHDATLERTHNVSLAVSALTAAQLKKQYNVPTLKEVLHLDSNHVLIDFKLSKEETPTALLQADNIAGNAEKRTYLIWHEIATHAAHPVYFACARFSYAFFERFNFAGITTVFSGTVTEIDEIELALRDHVEVNLYVPTQNYLDYVPSRCSITRRCSDVCA